MSPREKEIQYRAGKLVEQRGITLDEAIKLAIAEIQEARSDQHKNRANAVQRKSKGDKKPLPIYTVGGSIVDHVVQGGSPGHGKKR